MVFHFLIDKFCRKFWILRRKSEAFYYIKGKALVRNQRAERIKCLRTVNGIEYTVNEVEEFNCEYGIHRQFIVSQ